jgi:glycosyltransferase involved in cell wall biosynthesis
MQILHVLQTLDPNYGGPPMVASRLAAAQAALGHRVSVLSYVAPSRADAVARATSATPNIAAVERIDLDPERGLAAIRARAARGRLARLTADANVVHIHGVWEPIVKAAADAARRNGTPYVIRPFGTLDPWCLAQKKWKKKVALALGYRRMLRDATCIHALNADEARFVEDLRLGTPIRVIPNGIFPEEFSALPERGSFYAEHPELEGAPYVLFLSRIHYKKGVDYLASAFSQLARKDPRIRLVVAGPDEGARESFEADVKAAGLSHRVHLTGPLLGRAKLAAFVDATCFCLPSRQEGFSVAITEALACGTPVVITEPCHFPEVAEAGAGEVVPLDADSVAAALTRVLENEGLRARMSAAGRSLVRERFTWPVIAKQTIEMYGDRSQAG